MGAYKEVYQPSLKNFLPSQEKFLQLWRSLETKAFSGISSTKALEKEVPLVRLEGLYRSLFNRETIDLKSANALFSSHGIQFSQHIAPVDLDSTLAHEMAHVLIEEICPGKFTGSFLIHETLAQWISGDFNRISYRSSQFAYSQKARSWLTEWKDHPLEQQTASYAVARLLLHVNPSPGPIHDFVSESFLHCRAEDFDVKSSQNRLLTLLTQTQWDHHESLKKPAETPDIFLVDGLSMEPILDKGKTKQAFPPGSILKPLLIAQIPDLRLSTVKGSSDYWNCHKGAYPAEANWTWQKALIHSCNGFFLEHPRLKFFNFKGWINLLDEFKVHHPFTSDDIRNPEKVLQVSLGLVPGISITPTQVVGLYRWLYDHSPEIALALVETSSSGTLNEAKSSSWFYDQNFALKTGTLRNSLNQPLDAWIVGLGPIKQERVGPDFVFAIHGNGQAPLSLLPHAEEALKKLKAGVGFPTKVQILSQFNFEANLEIFCKNQIYALTESAQVTPSNFMLPKTVQGIAKVVFPHPELKQILLTCYEGPLKIRDRRQPSKTYDYYGRLRVLPPDETYQNTSPWPVSSHRAHTRRGSPLVIETSARHYLKNVIASEYPNGYEATLKVLALAVGYNAQSSRHGERPLCDSTHCQVFSSSHKLGTILQQKRLNEIVQWSLSVLLPTGLKHPSMEAVTNAQCAPRDWYPFSVGGLKEWMRDVSQKEIATAFNLTEPEKIHVSLNHLHLATDQPPEISLIVSHRYGPLKVPCEVFRNQLRLPSCPLRVIPESNAFRFFGRGEGHGQGIDLKESDLRAGRGDSEQDIFKRYFPRSPPFCKLQWASSSFTNP